MLILAHRGYHAEFPENTMAAFAAAVALGLDGIETDVRLSRDGQPLLYHHRFAPNGVPVSRLTRLELENIAGHGIPTLDEALHHWPDILWNLEIKAPAELSRIAAILPRSQESHRLLITSFSHNLATGLAQHVAAECGVILRHRPGDMNFFLSRLAPYPRLRTIVSDYKIIGAQMLVEIRAAGFRNFVYGAITPYEHAECARLGVDGLITDYPERAKRVGPL